MTSHGRKSKAGWIHTDAGLYRPATQLVELVINSVVQRQLASFHCGREFPLDVPVSPTSQGRVGWEVND